MKQPLFQLARSAKLRGFRHCFRHNLDKVRGQSLIEILLGIGFFALLAGGGATLGLAAFINNLQATQITKGLAFAVEGMEGGRAVRSRAWNRFSDGTTGLKSSNSFWEYFGSNNALDQFTRTITVTTQKRDSGGNIAGSGTNDIETKKITSTVTWDVTPGRPNSIVLNAFLTHWKAKTNIETTKAEFDDGTFNNTNATNAAGGEVQLTGSGFACFRLAGIFDTTGVQDGRDVYVSGTTAFFVTDNNPGGAEFYIFNVSDPDNPTLTGSLELGAGGQGVVASGSFAYVASESNTQELQVINISNLAAPTLATTLNLSGTSNAKDVAISGNTLFIVTASNSGGDEFYVINVTTPTLPVVLGSLDIAGDANAVTVSGNVAYVATSVNTAELKTIDISVLAVPTLLGSFEAATNSDANDVYLVGTTAYLVTNQDPSLAEFYIINVTNPASPTQYGNLDLTASINSVTVLDNIAILGTSQSNKELKNILVSDPTSPSLISEEGTSGAPINSVYTTNNTIYLATNHNFAEFQIHAPIQSFTWQCPNQTAIFDTGGNGDGSSVVISGNTAYLTTKNNSGNPEFLVLNITNPLAPTLLGSLELGADGNRVVVDGTKAYVASGSNSQELMIIDISIPSSPSLAGSFNLSGNSDAVGVAIDGTTAYLTRVNDPSGDELFIINVTNPAAPALLGSFNVAADANALVVSGGNAFLGTSDNAAELKVVNVFNPASPALLGTFNTDFNADANDVFLVGSTLHLVTDFDPSGADYFIVDVSNPAAPTLTGSFNLGSSGFAQAVAGDSSDIFIGVSTNGQEIRILNVTTPSAPVTETIVTTVGGVADGLFFVSNTLYVASANDAGEFQIYNITTGVAVGGFATSGTYESSVIDSGSDFTSWDTIEWSQLIPIGPFTLKLEFRAAASPAALSTAEYTGPDGIDGDSIDFFTTNGGELIHPSLNNNRYGQYRVTFTGNGSSTARLEDITVTYSP